MIWRAACSPYLSVSACITRRLLDHGVKPNPIGRGTAIDVQVAEAVSIEEKKFKSLMTDHLFRLNCCNRPWSAHMSVC